MYNLILSINQQIWTYEQYFTKQILVNFSINLVKKVEPILVMPVQSFLRKICIEKKCKTIKIVKKTKNRANLFSWCNKFKLNQGTKAAVI